MEYIELAISSSFKMFSVVCCQTCHIISIAEVKLQYNYIMLGLQQCRKFLILIAEYYIVFVPRFNTLIFIIWLTLLL
jgi:hypothetical protein